MNPDSDIRINVGIIQPRTGCDHIWIRQDIFGIIITFNVNMSPKILS